MSDLGKWDLHGPVKTVKRESASWDANRNDWQAEQLFTAATFRRDGQIASTETHNPDGSIAHFRSIYDEQGRMVERGSWMNDDAPSRIVFEYDAGGRQLRTKCLKQDGTQKDMEVYSYDQSGVKTKVEFWSVPEVGDRSEVPMMHQVEGTNAGFTVRGAAIVTVFYDESDRPARVTYHDANHQLIASVTLTRDSEGRVVREEMRQGEKHPLYDILEKAPPEQREQVAAMINTVIGETMSSTTYTYDEKGRLVVRENRVGQLGGDRTTYRYGEHDDPIEETTEQKSREAGLDEAGKVQYSSDSGHIQHNRYEYVYDAQGNWTERIVSYRLDAEVEFRRSNMERRTITYY